MVRSHSFVWILISLLSLALAAPSRAAIMPTGDVDPTDLLWWTTGGDGSTAAHIGKTGTGSVTVDLDSDLSSGYGFIGASFGSTGDVTVDGGGSTWTTSVYVHVGFSGQGTLNITNGGAVVTNANDAIGYYSRSTGDVTVDGGGSTWTNSRRLLVGLGGHGTLNITNGGAVSNTYGQIASYTDSTGDVTVDGGDSTWTNSGSLYVGGSGGGTLNITGGGAVSNTYGYIGHSSGSTGVVTVGGSGSTWTNSRRLYVGGSDSSSGGASELTVRNGGSVAVDEALKIWGAGTLNIGATGKVSIGGALVLMQDSTLTADAGATIHMTGSAFQNESVNSADLAGLGNLAFVFEGGPLNTDPFEVAGKDMGAVIAGYDDNFALGTLQLGGADIGQIQLVDAFGNQPGWVGDEAVYVKNLALLAGSTLDLNGFNLYYYRGEIDGSVDDSGGGELIHIDWIKGDANWDIKVDDSDLSLLLTGWATGTTWQEGDFDGDGDVDDSDLSLLLTNWYYPPASSAASAAAVPEPATMLLLAIGGLAILKRKA